MFQWVQQIFLHEQARKVFFSFQTENKQLKMLNNSNKVTVYNINKITAYNCNEIQARRMNILISCKNFIFISKPFVVTRISTFVVKFPKRAKLKFKKMMDVSV